MKIYVHDWFISPYAICMLLAILTSFLVAFFLLKREGIDIRVAGLSVFMNLVFVMLGGKLYTIILYCIKGLENTYADSLEMLLYSPFSSVGGMLGMLAGIFTFNRIYGEKREAFWVIYSLIIPLLYSISKVGCFLMGCCHGIEYDGIGHITYVAEFKNPQSIVAQSIESYLPKANVFPIQMCSVIIFMLIFLIALGLYLKKGCKERIIWTIMSLGALAKFSEEFLRADHTAFLNLNQVVCLILLGIVVLRGIKL